VARVCPKQVVFFECDVQSKFGNHILGYESIVHNSIRMAQVSRILGIPLISTEHIKFGTIDERILNAHHEGCKTFLKKTFSMLDQTVDAHFKSLERKQVVIYGLETHVCV